MIHIDDVTKRLAQFDPRNLDLPFELPKFDMPKFEMPKFELPKFELPKFELPAFEMPKVELPKVDLPKVDVPGVEAFAEPLRRAADAARDAAYAGVGAVVVAAQAIDERRRQLTARFSA